MNRLLASLARFRRPHVHVQRSPSARAGYVVTRAESAQCTCPDFCERDHETD